MFKDQAKGSSMLQHHCEVVKSELSQGYLLCLSQLLSRSPPPHYMVEPPQVKPPIPHKKFSH